MFKSWNQVKVMKTKPTPTVGGKKIGSSEGRQSFTVAATLPQQCFTYSMGRAKGGIKQRNWLYGV